MRWQKFGFFVENPVHSDPPIRFFDRLGVSLFRIRGSISSGLEGQLRPDSPHNRHTRQNRRECLFFSHNPNLIGQALLSYQKANRLRYQMPYRVTQIAVMFVLGPVDTQAL